MTNEDAKPETQDTTEVAVCPNCMTENHPLADFCRECGMPLSSLATMDPMKRIYAQGWIYHKAVTVRRPRPIIVLGMWLIFGPLVLTESCCLMGTACSRGSIVSVTYHPLGLIPLTGLFLLYSAILWRVTRNYLRYRGYKPGQCEACGYSLFGLTESRCPGCGTPFHPDDLLDDSSDDEEVEVEQAGPEEPREPAKVTRADVAYAVAVACCIAVVCLVATLSEAWLPRGRQGALNAVTAVTCVLLVIFGFAAMLDRKRKRRSWLFWLSLLISVIYVLVVVLPVL